MKIWKLINRMHRIYYYIIDKKNKNDSTMINNIDILKQILENNVSLSSIYVYW